MTNQPGADRTHAIIRQCGGIVHSDGNIFFASRYQFEYAASILLGTATVKVESAGEYLAKVEADPKRAAALQRARERAGHVPPHPMPAPAPAHSKSEYKRRVAQGDPSVQPPPQGAPEHE